MHNFNFINLTKVFFFNSSDPSLIFSRQLQMLKTKQPPPTITSALFESFAATLFSGHFFQLAYVLLVFVNPQILNLIIAFVQGGFFGFHFVIWTS